ncbi:phage holin family protein [uncultured Bifidobacterium sp.]|uniref:phage holin family protein n=1 Tax=uncultured Bifidobacterium sp. TaxID=165187 RepID=UPI0025907B6A|nr:phage holin family protein [uncultured Bifidobacterium sp.]MEE0654413.1 phage holin family protein [Bifidobacterium criceti]
MVSFLIRWAILTVAAGVMVVLLPGMHAVGHPPILGVAAFALFMALLNASIKPVVQMLALPFSILSFGLVALIINWLFMELASWLALKLFDVGVTIDGFLWAILGSLIMSVVSGIVSSAVSS